MWLYKIMGLIDKVKKDRKTDSDLTVQDCEFILTKLRSASYKGDEFEQFYIVFKKVTEIIEKQQ